MMIEHNAYMLESSDFVVDFGRRQQEPVTHLDVTSHDDYFKQDNHSTGTAPLQIASTLATRNGIQYLEDNHISYFKNAENIYKGGILKAYLPWLVLFTVNTNPIRLPLLLPLIWKDIYIANIVFYEIGGLINHIVAAHPTNKDTRSFDFTAKKIIVLAALVDWKLKNSILILSYKTKTCHFGTVSYIQTSWRS